MVARHRELVDKLVSMVNSHDLGALDDHTASGHIDHNPVVPDGIEANRAFWAQIFEGFPDITATAHQILADGDLVAARLEYRGTHLGSFLGIPATGRSIAIQSIDIWRVEDGLLAEHWDQLNLEGLIRQLTEDQAQAATDKAA
jgi:steroid delta-isomerase-like uncharacterized protein